ncbi:MAG: PAS domain-containing protein, partial [candidate division NC10 bacterium]|nr:PAS domain-containing protein [candidate division NC10 bacterium]
MRRRKRSRKGRKDSAATPHKFSGQEARLYLDLYEHAPVAYVSVGPDGRILRANRSAAELFGYGGDDLVGRPVLELYADTPAGKEKASQVLRRFQAGEDIRDEELEIRTADGRHRLISLSVRPAVDEHGDVVGSRSIAVDVTERKRAEETLHALYRASLHIQEPLGLRDRLSRL